MDNSLGMDRKPQAELVQEDLQARKTALDVSRSFLMQAPAGSGKTEVLTQRFLALLARVEQPEQILALTFTRKAASEMRYRVLKALHLASSSDQPDAEPALSRWRLARDVLKRNQELNWGLLASPHRLRLMTIDSLCANLVKQSPLAVQYAGYTVAQDAQPLYSQAVQTIFSDYESEWLPSLQRLLMYFNTDHAYFQQLLSDLLANRDAWLSDAQVFQDGVASGRFSEDTVFTLFDQHLQSLKEALTKQLHNAFSMMDLWDELWALVCFAQGQLGQVLRSGLRPAELTAHDWQALSHVILKKDGGIRARLDKNSGFPTTAKAEKQAMQAILQRLAGADQWPLINMILQLLLKAPVQYTDDPQHGLAFDLFRVGLAAVNALDIIFKQHRQVDFLGLAQAAFEAFGDEMTPTELMLRFDHRIQHLLMDEFQDTALSQIRLFERLISGWQYDDGRTLFFVGDPMQSIYGFRKADVNLFYDIKQNGLAGVPLDFLQLRQNFRTKPALVNELQSVLAPLFPAQEDSLLYQVTFSKAVAKSQEETQESLLNGALFEDKEHEISWMINQIQACLRGEGNIAILIRKKSQVPPITQALRRADIPYTAVDLDPLWAFTAVKDLFHLAAVLFDTPQLYHYMAVCRTPFVGLSLSGLVSMSQEWKKDPGFTHASSASFQQLPPIEQERVTCFLRILVLFKEATHLSVVERLRGLWYAMLGPEILDEEEQAPVEAFWDVLEEVTDAGRVDIQRLQAALEKSNTSVYHPDARIEIMTIHRSKGLEFGSVFVPFMQDFSGRGMSGLVEILTFQLGNMHVPQTLFGMRGSSDADQKKKATEVNSVNGFLKAIQNKRDDHELARLFYVAVTRAEHQLFLSATLELNSKGEQKPKSGSILEQLIPRYIKPAVLDTTEVVETTAQVKQVIHPLKAIDIDHVRRVSQHSRWLKTRQNRAFKAGASQKGDYWPAHVRHQQGAFIPRARGELIHHWLSSAQLDWLDKPLLHWKPWFAHAIKSFGWRIRQQEYLIDAALVSLEAVISSDHLKWVLQERDVCFKERAWQCLAKDKSLMTLRPDLVFEEDEHLWIVDFKTTEEDKPLSEKHLKQAYGEQLSEYVRLFKKQGYKKIKPAVFIIGASTATLKEMAL
ncbi:MAG: UvrD-helicase domain-containing protein [Pseudomonadota bacterium]|nr:UvrD-helicase domain-containing protein [Pseudomonadota bacterium]